MPFEQLVSDVISSQPTDITPIMNLFPQYSCEHAALGLLEFKLMKKERAEVNDVLFYGISNGASILRRDCESFLHNNFYSSQNIPRLLIVDQGGQQLQSPKKSIPNPARLSAIYEGVTSAKDSYEKLPSQKDTPMIDLALFAEAKLKQACDFTPLEPVEVKGYLKIMLDRGIGLSKYALSVHPKGTIKQVLEAIETDDRTLASIGEDGQYKINSWREYLEKLVQEMPQTKAKK